MPSNDDSDMVFAWEKSWLPDHKGNTLGGLWLTLVWQDTLGCYKPMSMGALPSHETWREIKNAIDEFYNTVDGTYIDRENIEGLWAFHETDIRKSRRNKKGCVYIVRGRDGFYKVGATGNWKKRLQALSRIHGHLEIIMTIESENSFELEGFLHDMLWRRHVHDEWFALTENDLKVTIPRILNLLSYPLDE
ncbi:MAG TPA: GIY-YIG nuclease family protein [Sedimentisphaerales bacterium]|nr:GIY-YIG nuclease family protein [Sedimentisphaerales bacterium]